MAIRPILEVPDPRLRVISEPVTRFDDSLHTLVADMFDTMYAAPGIGLAAIQVGEPLRLVVMDLGDDRDEEGQAEAPEQPETRDTDEADTDEDAAAESRRVPRIFVNPEILDPSPETNAYREGCLSVPEQFADVDRPATCRARWQDLDGQWHEEVMTGLMATCFQHEMDHLQGIVFIDHLSRLKRDMILKRLNKARRAA